MPKIFLIKKRLHEQQLGLQEGQELLASKADTLCPGSPLDDGPIALLSKKDKECIGESSKYNINDYTIIVTSHIYIYTLLLYALANSHYPTRIAINELIAQLNNFVSH